MPVTMKELGLDKLSAEDRELLAHELIDSVVTDIDSGLLTEAQKAELERRLAAYHEDPKAGSPWEEVEARLLGSRMKSRAGR